MQFIPEFHDVDRVALKALWQTDFSRAAEVGSWLGLGSTQTLMVLANELFCIDTWQGSFGVEHHAEIASRVSPIEEFRRNAPMARMVQGDSAESAHQFHDGYFDLVFIDADHRYSLVKRDIEAWLPKVRNGGILCGHDCEMRIADESMLQTIKSLPETDTASFNGKMIHPGVVAAVYEQFDDHVHLCCESSSSSIWWVRIQ